MSTGLLHRQKTKAQQTETYPEPALESQLRQCMEEMQHNQMLFDLETEPELVEQRVFEYRALQCRYSYLQRLARSTGLRVLQ